MKKKAVTLISLVITITIMLIIVGIIVYSSFQRIETERLSKINTDIENLSSSVNLYYLKNEEIPVVRDEEGQKETLSIEEVSNVLEDQIDGKDNDTYYIIDVSYLDNISLNSYSNTAKYIINEKTHNIYYVECTANRGGEHVWIVDINSTATCTEGGRVLKQCICGETVENEEVPPLGHDYTEATCTEEGVCRRCGATIPALGHDYSATFNGYDTNNHWKKCSRCDSIIDSLPHTKSWISTNETEHWQECSVCDWESTKVKHNFEYETQVEATCTTPGEKKGSCTCGKVVDEEIPALGHDFSSTFNGFDDDNHWKKCSRCSATTEVTPHTKTWVTTDGTNHWQVCNICGWTSGRTKHEYTYTTTKEPTCTEKGSKKGVCNTCGREVTEEIPALGHDFSSTFNGFDDNNHWKKCSRCSATTEVTPHTKTWVKTDETNHWQVCNTCGWTGTKSVHNYTYKTTKEPTCTEKGTKQGTCNTCGRVITESIPALGHNFSSTFNGYDNNNHWKKCSRCSATTEVTPHTKTWVKTDSTNHWQVCNTCGWTGEKSAHSYTYTTTKEPTCTVAGSKKGVCNTCGREVTEEIPALGHDFSSTFNGYDDNNHWKKCSRCSATTGSTAHTKSWVTTDGTNHWQKCSGCGWTSTKSAHIYTYTTTKEPTCTVAGSKKGVCNTCGKTVTESIPALGHNFSSTFNGYNDNNHWKKCSRCSATTGSTAHSKSWVTTDGTNHWQKCSSCGWTSSKSAHSYTYTTTKEPTCTVAGSKKGVCNTCGKTITESIPALGHNYSSTYNGYDDNNHWKKCSRCSATTGTVAHTKSWVTTDGTNHWQKCSSCGWTSAKSAHSYTYTTTKEPTCTATGTKQGKCNTCGKVITETIKALGHNYSSTYNGYNDTNHWKKCSRCSATTGSTAHSKSWVTTDGTNHWQKCSSCGWTSSKSAHSYTYTTTKAATCTATGTQQGKCNTCGKIITKSIPALGHKYSSTYNGYDNTNHWKKCSRCSATTGTAAHTKSWVTTDGTNHWQKCSSCGWTGTKSAHSYTYTTTKAATCTATGTQQGKCNTCGKIITKSIPALGHKYSSTYNGYDNTYHWKKCSRCSAITGKTAHSKSWVTTDGTNHWQKCSSCSWTSSKSAHSYTYTTTKAATCTATGTQQGKCNTCGKIITKSIPALGHKYSSTYNGYDNTYHWKKCSRCSATTGKTAHSKSWTSDATYHWQKCSGCSWTSTKTAHSYTYTTITPATCEDDGTKQGKCTCGRTVTQTIPALGGNHTGATVSNDGTCTRCGEKYITDISFTISGTQRVAYDGVSYNGAAWVKSSQTNYDILSNRYVINSSSEETIPLGDNVTYTSSNTSALTINSSGLVTTPKSAYGLTTITVKAGKYSATLKVMIVNANLKWGTWNHYASSSASSTSGTIKADMMLCLQKTGRNRWRIWGLVGGSYTGKPMWHYVKGLDEHWIRDI